MDRKTTQLVKELHQFKQKTNIEQLYLFGSRVTGKTHRWSDVDLIAISRQFRRKGLLERAKPLYLSWNLKYPVDFLCYTPEEFNKFKRQISIVREAVEHGIEVK